MAKNNWMDWCIDRKYVFARFDYSSYIPTKGGRVQRETEALVVSIGGDRGVSFTIQWRSYQPEEDGHEPRMLALRLYLYGWGFRHGWDHWQWTIIKPKGELQ